jgi:hypothetical protein
MTPEEHDALFFTSEAPAPEPEPDTTEAPMSEPDPELEIPPEPQEYPVGFVKPANETEPDKKDDAA